MINKKMFRRKTYIHNCCKTERISFEKIKSRDLKKEALNKKIKKEPVTKTKPRFSTLLDKKERANRKKIPRNRKDKFLKFLLI